MKKHTLYAPVSNVIAFLGWPHHAIPVRVLDAYPLVAAAIIGLEQGGTVDEDPMIDVSDLMQLLLPWISKNPPKPKKVLELVAHRIREAAFMAGLAFDRVHVVTHRRDPEVEAADANHEALLSATLQAAGIPQPLADDKTGQATELATPSGSYDAGANASGKGKKGKQKN